MNIYKELKKNVIEPTLKSNNFKKLGNTWYRQLETGIIHIVEIGNRTVKINDFALYINFGIYYTGVKELTYGFNFQMKDAFVDCIFKGVEKQKEISQFWDSNDFTSYASFAQDVLQELTGENKMISFLDSITTGEQLLSLFSLPIESYIKTDSVLALQIGCLNFLLGYKEEGRQVIQKVIDNSKTRYEFAEKIFERIHQS